MSATLTKHAGRKPSPGFLAAIANAKLAEDSNAREAIEALARAAMPTADEVAGRYRLIAGPYRHDEKDLLDRCLATLNGCRVVVARGREGLEVWRLRSECCELRGETETDD